ncbi:MAG: UvrD-helicase domain-containing protein [Clostridia bacterium]|nr:UvrD-helicase domain-containing protein [Clostridia bacterium]
MNLTKEQQQILNTASKKVVVSASAGSGKTFVLVEKLISLIRDKKVPVSKLLVLTFTKAAANEMKSRLVGSMLEQKPDEFILEQIDDISVSDISTIDSFCEKIIKRNISKLDIDEGFSILDEHAIASLKKRAFQSAFDKFATSSDMFDTIYFAFKKDKTRIEECVFELQSYFDSLAEDDVAERFLDDYQAYQKNAYTYLSEAVCSKIETAKKLLGQAQHFADIPEKAMQFVFTLLGLLDSIDCSCGFYSLCQQICLLPLPDLPRHKCDVQFKKLIAKAKELAKQAQAICQHYKDISSQEVEKIESGCLAKALLSFYKLYKEKYSNLKKGRSALDFADIERYAKILLQDDEIKKALQERYDYIFIDEYQDTNRLQESILKPIALGGHFTAVGDIKQGIYGFRNASKEIMLQDIEDFSADEEGEALYLTGNFRTDANILSFVNDIFEKIMTKESAGIEYKANSMLKGLKQFKQGPLMPLSIDIVVDDASKEDKKVRSGIYSVKEDEILPDEKYKLEIETIIARVDEALGQEIYDTKKEVFRQVNQSDIALLFRNRSSLMKECVKSLQAKGYAVEADIKNSLLEDSQIKVINALLKLCLNLNDDISLAAVMCSAFGGFSVDEIAALGRGNSDQAFHEIVLDSQNEKVCQFVNMVKEFAFNIQVQGIIKSLQQLFNKSNYYGFLKSLPDGREKTAHINDLFKLIRSCDFDFKPMSVISSLEEAAKQKTAGEGNVDAITVTTIHATKGLEYPIVILCGCGESLTKVYNKNYITTSKFGLGTYEYDFDSDRVYHSPAFLAGKLIKAKEEFEGELMVFYVAMTRAQNHLYIIGSGKQKNFTFDSIENQNSYLKMIMYALGENFTTQLFEEGQLSTPNRRYQIVSEVEEEKTAGKTTEQKVDVSKFEKEIKAYQEFAYDKRKNCKLSYKNSVTGVLKLEEDDIYVKEYNLNEENANKIQNAVDRGNAYHEALKLLDFSKIASREGLDAQFEKIRPLMKSEYIVLIDKNILYNNITLINSLLDNQKVFKEHEFLMKCTLQEVGFDNDDKSSVIVQGIVDFFAIGEKNILIDYKYTSVSDEKVIKERYQKQIELYSMAIERAFNIKIDERYLLSLKNSKIIKL